MVETAPSWLAIARRPDVVRRSLKVAALVGTILLAINHGDRILAGRATPRDVLKMALTYLVPFAVSTYASVQAIRREQGEPLAGGARPGKKAHAPKSSSVGR